MTRFRVRACTLFTSLHTSVRVEQFFHGTAPKPSLSQVHQAIFGYNQESTGRKLLEAKDETVQTIRFPACQVFRITLCVHLCGRHAFWPLVWLMRLRHFLFGSTFLVVPYMLDSVAILRVSFIQCAAQQQI